MNARSDVQVAGGVDRAGTVRVWDPVVRLFHWTVVAGCTFNLLHDQGDSLHKTVGYVVAAALGIRVAWGLVARGHARFSSFVPTPRAVLRHLGQLLSRSEPRYLGHTPAGAMMMMSLMALLAAVSLSGWMMTLDRFWGNESLEELHEGLANAILILAGVHVLAAVYESLRHHENLVAAMINGRKRRPAANDIDHAPDPDRR